MDTTSSMTTALVVVLAAGAVGRVTTWELRDRRAVRPSDPSRRRRDPRPAAFLLVLAVALGFLVGDDQWALAAIVLGAGVVFRVGAERHRRRTSVDSEVGVGQSV